MKVRGGPGMGAAVSLARRTAGVPPSALRRGGIASAVGIAAVRSPDRAVLVREHDSMTGRELDAAVAATADAMAARWPGGGRVGVRGDGGIDFVVALAAAGVAGVDAVAIGPRSADPVGVDVVNAWEVFVRGGLDTRRRRYSTSGAVQLLSTGTTGEPVATRRGRVGARGMLQLADADRRLGELPGPVLVLAPPDHGHGLSMVLAGLIRGRTVVLASGMRPAEHAEAAARHHVRTISGVPAQLERLWNETEPTGVQLVVSGSSRLRPELRGRLEQAGTRVLDCYGTTESGTVAIDGRPLAGVTIEADAGHRIRITSPLGGRGRVPGDLGRVEHGRLVLEGREGGLVDSGGELVSPERVEAELRKVPGVVSARVWAEDDELLGSRLCAEVRVSRDELDAGELARQVGERLGRGAVPRSLAVVR